jgi:hypothetical protein
VTYLPFASIPGTSMVVIVRNLTKSKLKLDLPKGTLFYPKNEGKQTLVAAESQLVELEGGGEQKINVSGYCTELHDHCSTVFSKVGITQNPKLGQLLSFMDSLKITETSTIQHSIWCVTDSARVANVYMDDNVKSKALHKFICGLTGQKDEWYSTGSDIVINERREIVLVPKEVKGDISYSSTVRSELQGVVKDSTGKIIVTNPHTTSVSPGNVKFEFKLTVQGWEKRTYAVVYTNNGQKVIIQPFTIE